MTNERHLHAALDALDQYGEMFGPYEPAETRQELLLKALVHAVLSR